MHFSDKPAPGGEMDISSLPELPTSYLMRPPSLKLRRSSAHSRLLTHHGLSSRISIHLLSASLSLMRLSIRVALINQDGISLIHHSLIKVVRSPTSQTSKLMSTPLLKPLAALLTGSTRRTIIPPTTSTSKS